MDETARPVALKSLPPDVVSDDRSEILHMVVRQGALMNAIGYAIGLVGSLLMGQVRRRFLFGIGPNDPRTLTAVSVVRALVGAIACFVPALRATRVSPLVALRSG